MSTRDRVQEVIDSIKEDRLKQGRPPPGYGVVVGAALMSYSLAALTLAVKAWIVAAVVKWWWID